MSSDEPSTYVTERIRETAASEAGQLGLHVEMVGDAVVLRGSVDSEASRRSVLCVAERLAGGHRVIDELECSAPTGDEGSASQERIDP